MDVKVKKLKEEIDLKRKHCVGKREARQQIEGQVKVLWARKLLLQNHMNEEREAKKTKRRTFIAKVESDLFAVKQRYLQENNVSRGFTEVSRGSGLLVSHYLREVMKENEAQTEIISDDEEQEEDESGLKVLEQMEKRVFSLHSIIKRVEKPSQPLVGAPKYKTEVSESILFLSHPNDKEGMLPDKPKWMPTEVMQRIVKSSLFPETIDCKGCGKQFPTRRVPCNTPCLAYYVHCVEECKQSRNLGLIMDCAECGFKFIGSSSFDLHNKTHHGNEKEDILARKPKWMPMRTMDMIIKYNGQMNQQTRCLGCQRTFSVSVNSGKNGRNFPLEYYVHCVEQCPEYRALGLISSCDGCEYLFLNKRALNLHLAKGCLSKNLLLSKLFIRTALR